MKSRSNRQAVAKFDAGLDLWPIDENGDVPIEMDPTESFAALEKWVRGYLGLCDIVIADSETEAHLRALAQMFQVSIQKAGRIMGDLSAPRSALMELRSAFMAGFWFQRLLLTDCEAFTRSGRRAAIAAAGPRSPKRGSVSAYLKSICPPPQMTTSTLLALAIKAFPDRDPSSLRRSIIRARNKVVR
jgi:hypothetical protein